jgi:uncharacterized membrane protein (DUF485 family)
MENHNTDNSELKNISEELDSMQRSFRNLCHLYFLFMYVCLVYLKSYFSIYKIKGLYDFQNAL